MSQQKSDGRQEDSGDNSSSFSVGVRKPLLRLSLIVMIAIGLLLFIRYVWLG